MKPEDFLPFLTKAQKKYQDKLKEVEIRKEALEQQFESNTSNKKKNDKISGLESKLEEISKQEEQSISYYRDEIQKAEQKFEAYKKYCMDHIERLKDKYDIKRNTLEIKKEFTNNSFDEQNDRVLNKLKLELKKIEDEKNDANATYESLVIKEHNWKLKMIKDKEAEAKLLETAIIMKQTAQLEEKNNIIFYQRLDESDKKDEKQYQKYLEEKKEEKEQIERNVILINKQLYNLRIQLSEKWNKKQETKWKTLSRDIRITYLDKSIEEILLLLK